MAKVVDPRELPDSKVRIPGLKPPVANLLRLMIAIHPKPMLSIG